MNKNPNTWTIKKDSQELTAERCEEILAKAATTYRQERQKTIPRKNANSKALERKAVSVPLKISIKTPPPKVKPAPKGISTSVPKTVIKKPVPIDKKQVAKELLERAYQNISNPAAFGQVDQLIKDGQLELAKKTIIWHERNSHD